MAADDTDLCALLRLDAPARPAQPADDNLIARAREHRVHLLLADRLRSPELSADLRAATARDVARTAEVRRVLDELASADVRPLLIKGAALAHTHYRRPELRPAMDTDMLIPYDRRRESARALATLGYERPVERDGDLSVSQFHMTRIDRAGLFHAFDIHWRISNVHAFAGALSYAEIARDAVPLESLGPHAFGPSAVHSLLIACIHRVAHHGGSRHLLWLYDIHLLACALDDRERAAFRELAALRGVRAVCAESLRLAAECFGDLPAPWLTADWGADSDPEPTAAWLDGPRRPVDRLRVELMSHRDWSWRVQLVREHLFPDRAFMYARYGTRRPLSLPFLYLHRIVTGAPKWFRR